jgi:hypothetical protein
MRTQAHSDGVVIRADAGSFGVRAAIERALRQYSVGPKPRRRRKRARTA